MLGRSKEIEELEKEIKQIENKLNKEIQDKEEYIASIENEEGIDSNLNENLNNLNIEYALDNQNLINIINEIDSLTKRIDNIRDEKENITKEKEENLSLIEKQEKELVDFDEKINAIQEEISMILMREVKDENIKFVTITGVDTTNDLSFSKTAILDFSSSDVFVFPESSKLEKLTKHEPITLFDKFVNF